MYFKIGPENKNDKFSYIIVKHPESKFEKSLGKNDGRKVYGKFDNEGHFYEGYVENDNLSFLEVARKFNMTNYIHDQLASVCQHNLKGFSTIFSSVIKGKKDDSLTDDEFFKPMIFLSIFGPFPCDFSDVKTVFGYVDIKAEPIMTDSTRKSFMYNLTNNKPISTTEFFQKLYIISYYLTNRFSLMKRVSDETVGKFVELSKNWLDKCEIRNSIVNRLCRHNKNLIEKFELQLIDEEKQEEKSKKINELELYLRKIGLGEKRHNLVLSKIPKQCRTLIDLGCAEGSFLRLLEKERKDTKVIGLEADDFKVLKANRRIKSKNIKIINSNILLPKLEEKDLCPEFLTAVEIIEHLDEEGRKEFIKILSEYFLPKEFIITTPNYDYNINYGLVGYRHRDHAIEYTYDMLEKEVLSLLRKNYDIEILKIFPEETTQPTFVIHGIKNDTIKHDQKLFYKIQSMYASIYLDSCNYEIRHKELSSGYSSRQYRNNIDNIFYLAPTMSPVEFDLEHPDYLEHPSACFKYYLDRGITELVAEEKYMGSRAYILIFKNEEQARMLGYNKITINSRQGYQFFLDKQDKLLDDIYNDVVGKIDTDFVMFDCEVMPWSIKAKNMIDYDFLRPGESVYLLRKYAELDTKSSEKYLELINMYGKDSELEIRPFHIIADGFIDKRNKFADIVNGFYKNQQWHVETTLLLCSDENIFKMVNYHYVDLMSLESREQSINKWNEYCDQGGEGFVYKPLSIINFNKSGYYIQPMLKVRGREYLRIIYGIDYLDPAYFKKLCWRKIKAKRNQAIQEFDLSMKILNAFLHQNKYMVKKLVGAFIGMENTKYSNIDATL